MSDIIITGLLMGSIIGLPIGLLFCHRERYMVGQGTVIHYLLFHLLWLRCYGGTRLRQ